jgi:hypothetical protein
LGDEPELKKLMGSVKAAIGAEERDEENDTEPIASSFVSSV